jgi:phosphate transport system substrate-binding protein
MKRVITLGALFFFLMTSSALAEIMKIGAGAAPTENVLKPIKTAFEKVAGLDLAIIPSGPKQAFIDLDRGTVDAAAAGLSIDDWMALLKNEGVTVADPTAYKPVTIGKDRVIVIVHKDNPIVKLSKEQLTGIFTGKFSSWKEVGGSDTPIMVVWGSLTQGTNSMFVKNIMDGAKPTTEVVGVSTAEDIRQNVSANPEAIGFGPQAILNGTVRSPETPEVARSITLITKGAASAKVQKLLDFIKAEGPKYIK